ncbi:MAG: metallophosphoesterase family protein [Sphaerochaetaceae bacterium]
MKKFLSILVIIFILITSCTLDGGLAWIDSNFEDTTQIKEDGQDSTFLLFSDLHTGRDDDSRVYNMDMDVFKNWINDNDINFDFALNLGDTSDNGEKNEYSAYKEFCNELNPLTEDKIFEIVGNHDIKGNNRWRKPWMETTNKTPYYTISASGVEFYCLDNAQRSFGQTQLKKLKEAVTTSDYPKIFLAHYPLYGNLNVYTYFALASQEEKAYILHLMKENDVSIYFCGHQHNGDADYYFENGTYQINIESFSGSTSKFESVPTFCIGEIDGITKELTLSRYEYRENNITLIESKNYNLN